MSTPAFGSRKKPRRFTGAVAPIAILIVAVLAVTWLVRAAVSRFEPIQTGSLEMPVGVRVADAKPTDGVDVHRVTWRDGGVVTYGVAIRNRGPVDVRVLAVEAPDAPVGALTLAAVRSSDPDELTFAPAKGEPFKPFTLADDDERFVTVDLKLGLCAALAEPLRVDRLRVRWSALGIERETAVPLDMIIELAPQRSCARG